MEKLINFSSKLTPNSTFSNFSKLNTSRFKKFGNLKAKSELRLFPNVKRFFPFLTMEKYSSNYLNNTKSSQELQRTLSFNKNKLLNNKKDILDLKIQYTKLQEENENNKKILSNILHLDNDTLFSKEELLEKIKSCRIENDKRMIVDSINIINLKLELNEKKTILKSKINEYNLLKENSKYKNYIEMQKQLSNNDDIKNEIVYDLEMLKDILEENKKRLDEKEEEYKTSCEKYKKLKKKEKDISEVKKEQKGKCILLKESISKLALKLQKQEIQFKQQCKTKIELVNSIQEKEIFIKEIKDYLGKRQQVNIKLQKRKEIIRNLEKKIMEIEKDYNEINNENDELSNNLDKNIIIFAKMDKKLKDDKKGNHKFNHWENNLKEIKFDLDYIKIEHINKIKSMKQINCKNLEIIEKNKNNINKKKDIIKLLEKQKNELEYILENSKKLEDLQNDIKYINDININENNNNEINKKNEKET